MSNAWKNRACCALLCFVTLLLSMDPIGLYAYILHVEQDFVLTIVTLIRLNLYKYRDKKGWFKGTGAIVSLPQFHWITPKEMLTSTCTSTQQTKSPIVCIMLTVTDERHGASNGILKTTQMIRNWFKRSLLKKCPWHFMLTSRIRTTKGRIVASQSFRQWK